ncbi:IS1634 family transposase [Haloplasma contractile]|uniref:Transposase DDE domain protein n=1 Tax=Haloplasma contractile SSD-17B TaxID=1033810 RepID=U2FCW0_9MOLU|nr:IS1634 family transposase [Haloplasma contractile]ERJ10860.1 Transposase DDE domain protein [Haloplasma contractile SSD-17B]
MFIRVTKSPTAKYSKVYLVEGYRDENGKSKQRVIKCYGNLEELQEKDPNILEKLKAEAKKIPKNKVNISLNLKESNSSMEKDQNYGFFFLERLYKDLQISSFLKDFISGSKHRFNLDDVLKLLVFGRILNPESKKATVERQDQYFEPFQVTLHSVYESLSQFNELKDDLQFHLHKRVSELYGRNASLVFYDVTNYYFEIDEEDELKKVGVSKENKKSPIVQMGLLIDQKGLPIAYRLFSGNTHDSSTLIPFLEEIREKYKLGKIILTADKGLNSGKNLASLVSHKDGYIVSQKVRGSSKSFLDQVLDEEGYVYNKSENFKMKSFLRERSVKNDKDELVTLKEKVVCFWSYNFDAREKKKREKLEKRIQEFVDQPSKYNASNRYGLKKYLKLHNYDKETGEIQKIKPYLEFDQEKYERDVSLDGYYILITSEIDLSDEKIIERYRGLWKIEESFKVLKSDLEGRPVYVRRNDHIEGHFLVCFIALLITRILELKLDYQYSVPKIQKSLKEATCRKIEKGIYSLNKQDEVYREIEKVFDVSLDYRFVRLEDLRSYRKAVVHNK